MAERISTAARNQQVDAMGDDWAGGTLEIYTGSQPASADDAPTGTLLCTITLPDPCFGASATGVRSKTGTWSGTAGATGDAGYFRVTGTVGVYDGSITATSGGGDMELDDISIESGRTVTINTFTLTQPAS